MFPEPKIQAKNNKQEKLVVHVCGKAYNSETLKTGVPYHKHWLVEPIFQSKCIYKFESKVIAKNIKYKFLLFVAVYKLVFFASTNKWWYCTIVYQV